MPVSPTTSAAGTATKRLIARIAAIASARSPHRSPTRWITGYENVAPKPAIAATTWTATDASYRAWRLLPADAVRQERPGGRIPLRREEVAPVLDHEPGPEGHGRIGAPRQLRVVGEQEHDQDGEDRESEGELVDSLAQHVDART